MKLVKAIDNLHYSDNPNDKTSILDKDVHTVWNNVTYVPDDIFHQ